MNRDTFFNALRPLFGGSLNTNQVVGIDAVLDACHDQSVADGRSVAYILATPMIETGGSFLTKEESLNYSNKGLIDTFGTKRISQAQANQFGRTPDHPADQPAIGNIVYGGDWGKRNLGNTLPDDGWNFRGRGLCQITGRVNYTKFEKLLGIPLSTNPDLAKDVTAAAKIMVVGMRDGLFTSRKLGDYFTAQGTNWIAARAIINGGGDRANDIATWAQKFFGAIKLAA